MAYVPSEDSDEPGHPPSLIRVFAVHSMVAKGPVLLHADSEDSDLSLRWAHMPFCWFCHELAHIVLKQVNRKVQEEPQAEVAANP